MTGEKGDTGFGAIERKWQAEWERLRTYAFDFSSKAPVFSIDTPPPTVSGRMHLGHAFSYTQADFIGRYKRMKGYNVFYPFGLDDNGLATERLVEKIRNIKAKNFTRKEFIKICLEETKKHEDMMIADFKSLGLSVDWSTLYRTIDTLARKICQKSLLEIYKNGRAYRKDAPTMWCPTCETTIAQAELEDKEFPSNFVYVKAEVEGGGHIVYATTRPELLHACICITVHPDDRRYKEVVGKKAKIPISNEWVPIIADESAIMDFGTGAVYWCPYSDATSIEFVAKHQQFKVKSVVGSDGRLLRHAGKYAGMKAEEARRKIIEDLQEGGHVEKIEPIKHDVQVHERCKTPIEVYSTKQWFVKYLDLKEEFLKKGRELKWYPEHMRVRYENWIKGLQWDWSISRQRFFGVPFIFWYCKKCGEIIPAGEKNLPVDPLEDKPPVEKCPKCGGNEFEPEKDVLDTWMTSSLTPQINSQWGVDMERHARIFPMSLRPQAHDIITLWAFNTIVKAYFHEGKLPWKEIMISGHALDPKGRKMSKSLGNAISPAEIISKYSADMLRYWAATGTLGEDLPFQDKDFVSGKKFLTKLMNASSFVAMKTRGTTLAGFAQEKKSLRAVDRWILGRFERVKKEATEALEAYEYSKALASLRNFFWLEFADFYIEEVKHRVYSQQNASTENGGKAGEKKAAWGAEAAPDAKVAKAVLLKINTELLKMLAPFLPHTTEEIFQTSFREHAEAKSIHLEKWPEHDASLIDEEAEKAGELAKSIIARIRKHKTDNKMAMNAEIGSVKVFLENGFEFFNSIEDDVKATMNIKTMVMEKGKSASEPGISIKVD